MKTNWKVCPIQGRQLLDVREIDLFGDFRLCNTYRGGGGYDKFPEIFKNRTGSSLEVGKQFVVQLYGCPLDCYYCYVTKDGVLGEYVEYTTDQLIGWFYMSTLDVFHLMGGAPGLYLESWGDIVRDLPKDKVFHSDLLLIEKEYKSEWFKDLTGDNVLLAVNVKGTTDKDFEKNTGKKINYKLFWKNLDTVVNSGVNFYITYTNPDSEGLFSFTNTIERDYGKKVTKDSYTIDLIEYDALKGEK